MMEPPNNSAPKSEIAAALADFANRFEKLYRKQDFQHLYIPPYNPNIPFQQWAVEFARRAQGDYNCSEAEMVSLATRKLDGIAGTIAQFASQLYPNDWPAFKSWPVILIQLYQRSNDIYHHQQIILYQKFH